MEVVRQPTPAQPAYTLAFDVALPEACDPALLRARLFEGAGAGDEPMIDWLLIHTNPDRPCPGGERVVRRLTISHAGAGPIRRDVGIIHPALGAADLFSRITVVP